MMAGPWALSLPALPMRELGRGCSVTEAGPSTRAMLCLFKQSFMSALPCQLITCGKFSENYIHGKASFTTVKGHRMDP